MLRFGKLFENEWGANKGTQESNLYIPSAIQELYIIYIIPGAYKIIKTKK